MSRQNVAEDVFQFIDMRPDLTPTEREKACWPWKGSLGGRPSDRRPYFSCQNKRWIAYRLVYILSHGPLDEKELVRHKCDNSICCNPAHLEKGTHAQNEQDKIERQRHGGTPRAVAERIRVLYKTGNHTQQEIADMYGISRQSVSDIVTGRRRSKPYDLALLPKDEQREIGKIILNNRKKEDDNEH